MYYTRSMEGIWGCYEKSSWTEWRCTDTIHFLDINLAEGHGFVFIFVYSVLYCVCPIFTDFYSSCVASIASSKTTVSSFYIPLIHMDWIPIQYMA